MHNIIMKFAIHIQIMALVKIYVGRFAYTTGDSLNSIIERSASVDIQ
jgi:hypothetical protein